MRQIICRVLLWALRDELERQRAQTKRETLELAAAAFDHSVGPQAARSVRVAAGAVRH